MLASTYVGLELAREVRRILTDCATELEALLNQLPADRPETWRALLDEFLANWERVGIKITAASRASLYALLEQAQAVQAPQAVGMGFAPQASGARQFGNGLSPIEQMNRAWELAAGLKEALLDGNPDRLLAEMRRIVDDLPKLVPWYVNVFKVGREAVAEAQDMLRNFIEFAEALPPEAKALLPDLFQILLDMVGLVPGFGAPIDVISGVISVYNGEFWQAALTILTVIPFVGILAGIAKILRRLDKLREAAGRLKGPAGKILLELIEFLAERLKRISVTSGDVFKQLKELYDAAKQKLRELIEKLRRGKQPPDAPKPKPKAPDAEGPKTPDAKSPDAKPTDKPEGPPDAQHPKEPSASEAGVKQPDGTSGNGPDAEVKKKGSLRSRMSDPPPGMKKPQAHHDLPEKFRDKFEAKGLDIDDPKNGRWVEGGPEGGHQKWSHEYNKEWEKFFDDHPNASKEEILEEVNKLRNDPRFQ